MFVCVEKLKKMIIKLISHFDITFCIQNQTAFSTGFRLAVLLLLQPASSLGKDSFVKRLRFVGVLLLREWVNVCKTLSFD